jgi:aminoglycoside 3-N-acetyltransferase
LENIYKEIGLQSGHHILVHSSYRKIRSAFHLSIPDFIQSLQNAVTENGSLIMPAFTYCFALTIGSGEVFDYGKSPAKTGAVSEYFRQMPCTIRTSSPTHSFSIWGEVTGHIPADNSPKSPLGKGSIPDWMADNPNTYILMMGTDFSSFTFGHYLETAAPVPWADVSPWDHLSVRKAGVSINGIQELAEIPGCSKSFGNLEKYLLGRGVIKKYLFNTCPVYYVPVSLLMTAGLEYFRNNDSELLCKDDECRPCCERRRKLNIF